MCVGQGEGMPAFRRKGCIKILLRIYTFINEIIYTK
jgi:hypothetical protein